MGIIKMTVLDAGFTRILYKFTFFATVIIPIILWYCTFTHINSSLLLVFGFKVQFRSPHLAFLSWCCFKLPYRNKFLAYQNFTPTFPKHLQLYSFLVSLFMMHNVLVALKFVWYRLSHRSFFSEKNMPFLPTANFVRFVRLPTAYRKAFDNLTVQCLVQQ